MSQSSLYRRPRLISNFQSADAASAAPFGSGPVIRPESGTDQGKLVVEVQRPGHANATNTSSTVGLELFGREPGGAWTSMQTVAAGDLSGGKNLLRGEFTVDLRPEMYLSVTAAPVGDDDNLWRNGSGDFVYTTDLVGTSVDPGDEAANVARIYYPVGYAPPGGWPVVVRYENSGFTTSSLPASGTDGDSALATSALNPMDTWLNSGYAVCWVQVNGASNALTDLGRFRARTDSEYTNSANPKAQKDAVYLMQYLRQYGYERHNINPDRICVSGQSGGAGTAAWVAWNTDFADPSSSIPMLRQSSVPNAFISYALPVYFPALAGSVGIGGAWFNSLSNPSILATDIGDIANGQKQAGSPIKWFLDTEEARFQWASMPMFFQWQSPITTTTFAQQVAGDPLSLPAIPGIKGTETHDGWNHYMLSTINKAIQRKYGAASRNKRFNYSGVTPLSATSGWTNGETNEAGYTAAELEDTLLTDGQDIADSIVAWLRKDGLPGPSGQVLATDININAWLETVS